MTLTPALEIQIATLAQADGLSAASLLEQMVQERQRRAVLVSHITDNTKWSHARLRLFSQTVTSAQIAAALETPASSSYEIGDLVSKHSAKKTFRKQAYWSREAPLSPEEPLDRHLMELIAFAEKKASVLARLRSDCTADLFCGFSSGNGQGGFTLALETLRRIGALGLALNVALYPPSDFLDSDNA